MQIVIDISKEKYDAIINKYDTFPVEMREWGLEAIKNGTPLPKGHGRLINADALLAAFEKDISKQTKLMELCKFAGDMKNYYDISKVQIGMISCKNLLNDAPTIIEADKGESEG